MSQRDTAYEEIVVHKDWIPACAGMTIDIFSKMFGL
jgi:hypothetical protein